MQVVIPGFEHALVYLFRGKRLVAFTVFFFHSNFNKVDNTGPQSVADVESGWNATQQLFPNANLIASSLGNKRKNLFVSVL